MIRRAHGVMFDLDGTLVAAMQMPPHLLEGAREALAAVRETPARVAVVTNQAGPAWRAATARMHYPTAPDVGAHLASCAVALGLTDVPWFVATYDARLVPMVGDVSARQLAVQAADGIRQAMTRVLPNVRVQASAHPEWRKPQVGALAAAAEALGLAGKPHDLVYVGDREEDAEAAARFACRFLDAGKWRAGAALPLVPDVVDSDPLQAVAFDIDGVFCGRNLELPMPGAREALLGLRQRRKRLIVATVRTDGTLFELKHGSLRVEQEIEHLAHVARLFGLHEVPWVVSTHPGPVADVPDAYVAQKAEEVARRMQVGLQARTRNAQIVVSGAANWAPPGVGLLNVAAEMVGARGPALAYVSDWPGGPEAAGALGVQHCSAELWRGGQAF